MNTLRAAMARVALPGGGTAQWTALLLIALAAALASAGCGGAHSRAGDGDLFPPALVAFEPYDGNPVFAGTGRDTWDKNIRERGWIMRDGDLWRMWYSGYNRERGDAIHLGYATSPDGLHWTRHPANPVFTGSWTEDMMVVKHDGVFYMAAEGRGDIAHMLTSTDGVEWTDRGRLDIRYTTGEPISPGPYGTPTLRVEDGIWYLFYERNDEAVWLARSTDLETWTNVRDLPVLSPGPEPYDRVAMALNQVIRHNGRYYAYYHATAHYPWRDWVTCVAVSDDLVNWTKYPGNPLVAGDKSSGIVVPVDGGWRLYTMHPDVRAYMGVE